MSLLATVSVVGTAREAAFVIVAAAHTHFASNSPTAARYDRASRELIDKALALRSRIGSALFTLIMIAGAFGRGGNAWIVAAISAAFAIFAAIVARRTSGMMDRRIPNISFFIGNSIYALGVMWASHFAPHSLLMVPMVILFFDGFGEGDLLPFVIAKLLLLGTGALIGGADPSVVASAVCLSGLIHWFSDARAATLRTVVAEAKARAEELRVANEQLDARGTELETSLERLSVAQARVLQSEKLAAIGELASGVVHEINNPTACVLSNHSYLQHRLSALDELANLLESGADAASIQRTWEELGGGAFLIETRDALGDLGVAASRIRDIVRDMKALARPENASPTVFDLNDAIRSAIRIAGAELKHRAVVKTEFGAALEVAGNPGRVSQVFVNLLVNAAQAVADLGDGRMHEIVVRSWREGNRVCATVTDDGPGIQPEHLSRIFETFFTTKGATVGTGLGLAISREIVQSHGGELRVESKVGDGATFVMTLPLAEPACARAA